MQQRYAMYAFIHKKLTDALARALEADFCDNQPCEATYLELMAGCGWLAKGLHESGLQGNYIATDIDPPIDTVFPQIEIIPAIDAVIEYRDKVDCYLLSWPEMDDAAAAAVAKIPSGMPVIYMGEWGGCCGTPELFQQLQPFPLTSPWWQRAANEYFNWPALRDSLYYCIKK